MVNLAFIIANCKGCLRFAERVQLAPHAEISSEDYPRRPTLVNPSEQQNAIPRAPGGENLPMLLRRSRGRVAPQSSSATSNGHTDKARIVRRIPIGDRKTKFSLH